MSIRAHRSLMETTLLAREDRRHLTRWASLETALDRAGHLKDPWQPKGAPIPEPGIACVIQFARGFRRNRSDNPSHNTVDPSSGFGPVFLCFQFFQRGHTRCTTQTLRLSSAPSMSDTG